MEDRELYELINRTKLPVPEGISPDKIKEKLNDIPVRRHNYFRRVVLGCVIAMLVVVLLVILLMLVL